MNKSDGIAKLAAALVKAKPQFKVAKMGSTNPFFKSKYADLGEVWEAVQDALAANGLTVSQFPDAIGPEPALTTCLIHESGEWMEATYPLMVTDKESTPQGYGSALTYARRYGLSAVLGVIADVDDDANQATRPPKPTSSTASQKPQDGNTALGSLAQPPIQGSPPAGKSRAEIARDWAMSQIPLIATMSKPEIDEFTKKFRPRLQELPQLDGKASTALDKAIADRLNDLFQ